MILHGTPGAPGTSDPLARWQTSAGFSDPDFSEGAPSADARIGYLSPEARLIYHQAFVAARHLLAEGVSIEQVRWEIIDRSSAALPGRTNGDFRVAEVQESAVNDALSDSTRKDDRDAQ